MIALVFCGDLKYCPYLTRYTKLLDENKSEYEVLFWNRGAYELDLSENYAYYGSASDLSKGKIAKLFDFFGFRKWLKKRIKSKKYDKLIILSTLSGVLIWDVLKKYKDKYIFDVRDYSFEHISLFAKAEKRIVENSVFTAISSEGFKSFLPKSDKYVLAHNFNPEEAKRESHSFKKNETEPLNVVWNGAMRFFAHQKFIIDALKNDSRFQLVYHGAGPELEQYEKYAKDEGIKNITFTGVYDNKDKPSLLANAHILNNSYGYGRPDVAEKELENAVSNRFYDGLIYHIPQFTESVGHKKNLVEKSGVGTGLKTDENFADRLYEYYMSISKEDFDKACTEALAKICDDDKCYTESIIDFIK
ncbi:MAG: hypothetical protein II998_08375 [Clostridia bacterium]|nr:hypothetical protein [Clostridia bacterium]